MAFDIAPVGRFLERCTLTYVAWTLLKVKSTMSGTRHSHKDMGYVSDFYLDTLTQEAYLVI